MERNTVYLWNPLEPYDSLDNEKHLNTEYCKDCDKPIDECRCLSTCCSAKIIYHDICSQCKDHV